MERIVCSSLLLLITLAVSVHAGEESVLGKKRSEWLKLLRSAKETKLRRAALIALEVLGPKVEGVSDGIIGALEKDDDPEVRRDAALTLGRIGNETKGAVDALADALKTDKDGGVREASARGLGRLAAQVETQVFILSAALTDPHAGTRAAAAEAINDLGDKAKLALPQLAKVLADRKADRVPRLYAARIVGRFESEAAGTVPTLIEVCVDTKAPAQVRGAAAESLGRLGTAARSGADALARILQNKAEPAQLRTSAAMALGKTGGKTEAMLPAIKAAVADSNSSLRYQGIRLAGAAAREQKALIGDLTAAATKDTNVENRLAAIQELGQLGNTARAAIPVLEQLTNDSRGSVRDAAQGALKKIQ